MLLKGGEFGDGAGGLEPKSPTVCVPKRAPINISICKFHNFPWGTARVRSAACSPRPLPRPSDARSEHVRRAGARHPLPCPTLPPPAPPATPCPLPLQGSTSRPALNGALSPPVGHPVSVSVRALGEGGGALGPRQIRTGEFRGSPGILCGKFSGHPHKCCGAWGVAGARGGGGGAWPQVPLAGASGFRVGNSAADLKRQWAMADRHGTSKRGQSVSHSGRQSGSQSGSHSGSQASSQSGLALFSSRLQPQTVGNHPPTGTISGQVVGHSLNNRPGARPNPGRPPPARAMGS